MKRSRWSYARRGCLVLLAAAFATGCSTLQPREDSVTLYTLAATPVAKTPGPARDVVVEVMPPHAWPGFDTAQMIYDIAPYELAAFAKSRWVDTPSRMIASLLTRALQETGGFRTVVQARSGIPAAYRLDTEIVRLLQDFTVHPSRVEITIRAQLTDVRAQRVVASRTFDESESAPTENAAGGVVAANAALQRVLERIAAFCLDAIPER